MDQQLPDQPSAPLIARRSYIRRIFQSGGEYFFQFFMLFLAVTAGFFADNLREDFSEKKQTQLYARSLVSDVARDSGNHEYIMNAMRKCVSDIDSLAKYVNGKKIEQLNNFTLYQLTRIHPAPPFRWSRASLEQIKSSGSLRYFNEDISAGISYYDALATHLDQDCFEDQQRYHDATDACSKVIDLSYPPDVIAAVHAHRDLPVSALTLRPVVATNIQDVHIMVNAYLVYRQRNADRLVELMEVRREQRRLINFLKKEYNLN